MQNTPTAPAATNTAAAALRFVAGLIEAGDAGGAELNFRVRAGRHVVELRPADAPEDAGDGVAKNRLATEGTNPAVAPVAPKKPGIRSAELLRHFLSEKERIILADLAAHPGTAASDLLLRCRPKQIEKSLFWVLWANLQHRGLVEDADVEGVTGGFKLAVDWVAELLPSDAAASPS